MPNKKFLEEYPLYKKFLTKDFNSWTSLHDIPKPAIHTYCWRCDSDQTFNMENEYWEVEHEYNDRFPGRTLRSRYICSACKNSQRLFFVEFGTEDIVVKGEDGNDTKATAVSLVKVGQNPPWSIKMDRELEKLLDGHSDYYKKGLICESQSYGIGAYAYFRRIAEDIIDDLLNSIFDLVEKEEEKEKYNKALAEVRKTKITEKKMEIIEDLLPKSLRVDGINPLKALHGALSIGLHGKTDNECMEQAEIIRNVLVYLVNQVVRTKHEKKSFTDGIKKLLSK